MMLKEFLVGLKEDKINLYSEMCKQNGEDFNHSQEDFSTTFSITFLHTRN